MTIQDEEQQQQQQQKQKDDIISYKILDHQEELLDEKYIPIIGSTMRRMPLDVLDTIASERNVRFFTITDQFYAVVKNLFDPFGAIPPEKRGLTSSGSFQLVIINDMVMSKLNPEEKQSVIAHELAHVYLEHGCDPLNEMNKDMEQEADDLIRSWGFTPNTKHSQTKMTRRAKKKAERS